MLDAIKKRRSYRNFKDQEIEEEKLDKILKAAQFSPSSNHCRPWEFIVVKDKNLKEKLSQTTPWASFAKQAPVILVVASSKNHFNWIEDCAIAAENIYLEATNQGMGTCYIQVRQENVTKQEDHVREVLDIPVNVRIACLMPLGYPQKEKPEHSEADFEEQKTHYNRY
jgi:nitroreductase